MKTNERGAVLVLTLVVTALLVALVIEFAYGVHTTQEGLRNWTASQALSLAARSGIAVAAKTIADNQSRLSYTYPGTMEFPLEQALPGFEGKLSVRLEDENGKFNLNALVWPNGTANEAAGEGCRRLLRRLDLDLSLADRIADWIDRDRAPRLSSTEDQAKNAPLDSVEELLGLPGMTGETYERLLPFVTVYGSPLPTAEIVNINSADIPVLLTLHAHLTPELAERLVRRRSSAPFERISDVMTVPGFEGALGQSLMHKIAVKAVHLRITAVAEEHGVRRIVACVAAAGSGGLAVLYWQER